MSFAKHLMQQPTEETELNHTLPSQTSGFQGKKCYLCFGGRNGRETLYKWYAKLLIVCSLALKIDAIVSVLIATLELFVLQMFFLSKQNIEQTSSSLL